MQWLNQKGARKLERLERHGSTFGGEVRSFAAEEIVLGAIYGAGTFLLEAGHERSRLSLPRTPDAGQN